MRLHRLFVVSVVLLVAADKPEQPKTDPDDAKLRGTWEIVSAEEEGKPQTDFLKVKITFKGNGEGEVIDPDGEKGRAVYFLDSSKKPKQIIFGFSFLIRPGIYKLEGEELTTCFSGRGEEDPPKKFSGSKESKATLWTLKKVK